MLVLTRKPGQSIQIGPDVVIHVLRINGSRIRLGVIAPRTVEVRRISGSLPDVDGSDPLRTQPIDKDAQASDDE